MSGRARNSVMGKTAEENNMAACNVRIVLIAAVG